MINHYYKPSSKGLLAPLAQWLHDPLVSEILINDPGRLWIEKSNQMTCYEVPALTQHYLHHLARLIANENGQRLDRVKPLLSGTLYDGSRVQIVMPPVVVSPVFAIRRYVLTKTRLEDYLGSMIANVNECTSPEAKKEACLDNASTLNKPLSQHSLDYFSQIKQAITQRANIVISGGTSTGKTTLLNALLVELSPDLRLVTLEDAREIQAPHQNQVNLIAIKGEQGVADVTLQDLLQCCFRLRPDRVIVGEIRGPEVLAFLAAASSGHDGSMTCVHASSPDAAVTRLVQLYQLNPGMSMTAQGIRQHILSVVDMIIQLNRTPSGRFIESITATDSLAYD